MVRVATLNLLNNPHGRWQDREALVVEQAKALDADVYAFQEVAARTDQMERLRDGLGADYRSVSLPHPDPTSIKSLAIVTRLDVAGEFSCTDLPARDLALRVDLRVGEVAFTVATTHLLFSPSRRGSDVRRAQAQRLVEWLAGVRSPTILLGDFNSRETGAAVAYLKEHFRSAHAEVHGREPAVTHPTPLVHAVDVQKAFGVPVFPEGDGAAVDYVFVRGDVEVKSCAVAWDVPADEEANLYPSDHYGLVADLHIR